MVVIDVLINNNDRNNGNWGILYEDNAYRLAPVYDNGASFSSKLEDSKIEKILNDKNRLIQSIMSSTTVYKRNEKQIFSLEYDGLKKAILRNIPLIQSKLSDIYSVINNVPKEYNGLYVCSDIRKEFYRRNIDCRIQELLVPAFEKVCLSGQN